MKLSNSRGKIQRYLPISQIGTTSQAQIALVPGEDAPLIKLRLPEGLQGGAREQVAKRQVIDTLGLSDETLDVRPLLQGGPAWSRVLVTAPDKIAQWGKQVSGTACQEILPDYLSLPAAKDIWTIELHGERVMARLGPEDGFSSELPLARLQLASALVDSPPRAVLWVGSRDLEIEIALKAAEIPVLNESSELLALGLPEPMNTGSGGVNLMDLAGEAQSRRRARIFSWRVPFILIVLAFGLWLSEQWISIARDNARADAIRIETTKVVRKFFVPSGPLLDIRSQVARRAAEFSQIGESASVNMSPITLLRQAAAPLTEPGLTLQSAFFRSGSGFELSVSASDFAALDTLAEALRATGLDVETTSAASDGEGGVFGQIQISEGS